jgi:hypothetical protein
MLSVCATVPLPEDLGLAVGTGVLGLYAETTTEAIYSYALNELMEDCHRYLHGWCSSSTRVTSPW